MREGKRGRQQEKKEKNSSMKSKAHVDDQILFIRPAAMKANSAVICARPGHCSIDSVQCTVHCTTGAVQKRGLLKVSIRRYFEGLRLQIARAKEKKKSWLQIA